jgi:hypothetical protein
VTDLRRLARRVVRPRFASVSLPAFRDAVGADVRWLPQNLTLIGRGDGGWIVHTEGDRVAERLWALLRYLGRFTPDLPPRWWMVCSTWDGWRERTEFARTYRWVEVSGEPAREWHAPAGEIPMLSATQPWVGCFAAHVGDPSAVLFPEAHYLIRGFYRSLFRAVERDRTPWETKTDRAIFCGTAHGDPENLLDHPRINAAHPRALLRDVVARQGLPVDVHLDRAVDRREQMRHKLVLDVDGRVRTFDAWAWKLASGSVVMSQESIWETWFTREFTAWEHFVPVANDFGDLAEKLEWCRAHDDECRAIAARAGERVAEVYDPRSVAVAVAATLRERLATS